MSDRFELDPRLAADTLPVATLGLCEVRLMNDARFGWLVLVPQRPGMVEIADLDAEERAVLWQEVEHAAAALRSATPCDKLNLGALGNIVRQLHVHLVARREGLVERDEGRPERRDRAPQAAREEAAGGQACLLT